MQTGGRSLWTGIVPTLQASNFKQYACFPKAKHTDIKRVLHFPLNSPTIVEVEVQFRPTVSPPVCPGVRRPSGTRDQFFFLLEIFFRHLRVCYFVAPSLTRGRVCNLLVQLLLGLARAVTLRSKSRRTHGQILLPHLKLPQPGGPGPRIYIPQGTGWPSYTPGHWVTFLWPVTTRRATVEVF
jgi:hypothetical protein